MKCRLLTFVLLTFSINVMAQLSLNDKGYFEMPGINVTVFADIYPEGHQTGVTVIQHGERVMANGDLRLEISPGQWSPIPKAGAEIIDKENKSISRELWFPDSSRHNVGFNPIEYPELVMHYNVKVTALKGSSFKVTVDLNEALPDEWVGKVGFNIELFPEHLFGKTFIMDKQTGLFTQQANGPVQIDQEHYITQALAKGKTLTIAPENDLQRIKIETKGEIALYDGRGNHNNGWYIVREELKANTTKNALEWIITPNSVPDWTYEPVIHVSQVGYHTKQPKHIVVETDLKINNIKPLTLHKINHEGIKPVKEIVADKWGQFLRYNYFVADISSFEDEGMYMLELNGKFSNPFKIHDEIYKLHVWQPVIEYFLPVQMCHMRVNEKYRVWHDACHIDDALMAPVNHNHFDGYTQGPSTLTDFEAFDPVPGLNQGGWHDAGDYDLRVESQIGTIALLAMMIEEFNVYHDATSIDWENRVVEIHQSDGENDIIQQIEHGLKSVLGAYRSMGRFYRGIICPTIGQYVMLGDGAAMTDNVQWNNTIPIEKRDDRWVFTEENPYRECTVGAGLAIASRALKTERPELSDECLDAALWVWENSAPKLNASNPKVQLAAELLLATGDNKYADALYQMQDFIVSRPRQTAWCVGKTLSLLDNDEFKTALKEAVKNEAQKIDQEAKESPFGIPYRPHIWGAGWGNQRFGVEQYFVNKAWPDVTSPNVFMNALSFNLGVHPGQNTASFASGIGSNSVLTAYGVNRADWSHIPGGVVSGTALIRPDLPELKNWPYFWQQTEYVMGGGSSNFMFLVLAVDHYLNKK